jgi:hypothetical protein
VLPGLKHEPFAEGSPKSDAPIDLVLRYFETYYAANS